METGGHNSSHQGRKWAVGIIICLVLYILSIGPVFYFVNRSPIDYLARERCHFIYAPLLWLVNNSNTADKVFGSYVSWWADLLGEPEVLPHFDTEQINPQR